MLFADSLKFQIISILCEDFPLQIGELKKFLKARFQTSRTNQAIHTALKELLAEQIVVKINRAYQLDSEFIIGVGKFYEKARGNYFSKSKLFYQVPKNGRREFTVNSLIELDLLYNSILNEIISNAPAMKFPYFILVPHAWFSICNVEAEIQITALFDERCTAVYNINNHNSPLDRWIERFYEGDKGKYILRSVPIESDNNRHLSLFGSYVIDARYPKPIAERLTKVFYATKNLAQLNLQELIAIVNAPCEMTVTLKNNRSASKRLQDKLLAEVNSIKSPHTY